METVIFVGIPGSGKTSFYQRCFFYTHVRISLDMLKTRHRERRFIETCFETRARFVVDNTNPTRTDRLRYIGPARRNGFRVIGYHFQAAPTEAIQRNRKRAQTLRVPDSAIHSIYRKMEPPQMSEGFDFLYQVRIFHGAFFVLDGNEALIAKIEVNKKAGRFGRPAQWK